MVPRQNSSGPHWSHSMAGQLGHVPSTQEGLGEQSQLQWRASTWHISGSTQAAGKEDEVKGHLLDVLDSLNNFHAAAQVGMPVLEFWMRPVQMLSGVSERRDNQKKAGPGTNSFLPQHCSVTLCQPFTFSEGTSSYRVIGVDHFIVNSARLSENQDDLREFDGSPV